MGQGTQPGANSLEGLELPITPELAKKFQEGQKKTGKSYAEIGKIVGASSASVHAAVNGNAGSSKLVLALAQLFNLDYLDYVPLDDEMKRVLRLLERLREAGLGGQFVQDIESHARVMLSTARPASIDVETAAPPADPTHLPSLATGTLHPASVAPPRRPPSPGKPRTRGSSG
jgi:hypothetical protein